MDFLDMDFLNIDAGAGDAGNYDASPGADDAGADDYVIGVLADNYYNSDYYDDLSNYGYDNADICGCDDNRDHYGYDNAYDYGCNDIDAGAGAGNSLNDNTFRAMIIGVFSSLRKMFFR